MQMIITKYYTFNITPLETVDLKLILDSEHENILDYEYIKNLTFDILTKFNLKNDNLSRYLLLIALKLIRKYKNELLTVSISHSFQSTIDKNSEITILPAIINPKINKKEGGE